MKNNKKNNKTEKEEFKINLIYNENGKSVLEIIEGAFKSYYQVKNNS